MRRVTAGVMMLAMMGVGTLAAAQSGSGTKNEQRAGSASKVDLEHSDMASVHALINAQALMALRNARIPMVLLDARGTAESRVPGSYPLMHDAAAKEIAALLPDKSALIVAYCGDANCQTSKMLGRRLHRAGYANVVLFEGGFDEWIEAGYDVMDGRTGSGTR